MWFSFFQDWRWPKSVTWKTQIKELFIRSRNALHDFESFPRRIFSPVMFGADGRRRAWRPEQRIFESVSSEASLSVSFATLTTIS